MIAAVRICRLTSDPAVACAVLQAELWLLQRAAHQAVEREKRQALIVEKLTPTLDDLTDLICSVNVPLAAPQPIPAQPIPAKPDEDDDL